MDSSTRGATSGSHLAPNDSPEQLLDIFKAAALSVTKLYKTSARAEARARADGYQDCLEDLLLFFDREHIGLCDGEGWRTRRWIAERLDPAPQSTESEDEADKSERTCSPEVIRTSAEPHAPSPALATAVMTPTPPPPPPAIAPACNDPTTTTTMTTTTTTHFVVPSQDSFSFQSQYPNIATLDLSDARAQQDGSAFSASRNAKTRSSSRSRPRPASHLGRGTGTKRKGEFDDFFGGCLDGKEPFGGGNKRNRHA